MIKRQCNFGSWQWNNISDALGLQSKLTSINKIIHPIARSIHETQLVLAPPLKTPTPYGGRLTWTLPGGNLLYVHIKNKNKIRHKKRWSQVNTSVLNILPFVFIKHQHRLSINTACLPLFQTDKFPWLFQYFFKVLLFKAWYHIIICKVFTIIGWQISEFCSIFFF